MLKNISRLEAKVGEKLIHLFCDQDTTLDHIKEALFQFSKFIGQIEDNARAAAEEEAKNKEAIEEIPKE